MVEPGKGEVPVSEGSGVHRLKRKLYENRGWVIFVIASFLIFVVPNWGLGANFGYAAWTCSLAVAIAVNFFWAERTKLWFWLVVTFILLVHAVALSSTHWTKQRYLGATYRALGEIDFIVTFAVLWLTQKLTRFRSAPPSLEPKSLLNNDLGQGLDLMHDDKG